MPKLKTDPEEYSRDEADQRRDDTLRRMLKSPPKRHEEMKVGKPRAKAGKSPVKRKSK